MKKPAYLIIAVLVIFCSIFAAGCLSSHEPPVTTVVNEDGSVTVTTVVSDITYTETYRTDAEPIVGSWQASVATAETIVTIGMEINGDGTAVQTNTSAEGETLTLNQVWAKIGTNSYYFFYSDTEASQYTGFSAEFNEETDRVTTMDGIVLQRK